MKSIKWKKLLTHILSAFVFLGCAACSTGESNQSEVLTPSEIAAIEDKIPDYSGNDNQFTYFAYQGVTDGKWTEYGTVYYCGEDFRTVERMKEFKEAGLHIMYMPASVGISVNDPNAPFDYESSSIKVILDNAAIAGVKVIVFDLRLWTVDGVVGEGRTYANEAELDAQIEKMMGSYASHPAFYGVSLNDEPYYTKLPSIGGVYRSIKRVFPESFILANLTPPVGVALTNDKFPQATEETMVKYGNSVYAERYARFETYLNMFLDETGCDYICYDLYPMASDNLSGYYLGGMQVAANVAKERGVKFHFVTQSSTMTPSQRFLTEEDCRWLNNMSLGFGVSTVGYWTYYTRTESSGSEYYEDGAAFVTHFGEKTDLYYWMQQIHKENQAFAPTILSFKYSNCATFKVENCTDGAGNALSCFTDISALAKVKNVTINKESALVTELYDAENDRYMYMLQNLVDPLFTGSQVYQTATIEFNTNYAYAVVFRNGERTVVRLHKNSYTVKQNPGEAVFILPFNA